jgi:hypothetical protein
VVADRHRAGRRGLRGMYCCAGKEKMGGVMLVNEGGEVDEEQGASKRKIGPTITRAMTIKKPGK